MTNRKDGTSGSYFERTHKSLSSEVMWKLINAGADGFQKLSSGHLVCGFFRFRDLRVKTKFISFVEFCCCNLYRFVPTRHRDFCLHPIWQKTDAVIVNTKCHQAENCCQRQISILRQIAETISAIFCAREHFFSG
ncbi:MAG: hypothetical protein AAFR02_10790, partial [Pseudomonadota bacterium]